MLYNSSATIRIWPSSSQSWPSVKPWNRAGDPGKTAPLSETINPVTSLLLSRITMEDFHESQRCCNSPRVRLHSRGNAGFYDALKQVHLSRIPTGPLLTRPLPHRHVRANVPPPAVTPLETDISHVKVQHIKPCVCVVLNCTRRTWAFQFCLYNNWFIFTIYDLSSLELGRPYTDNPLKFLKVMNIWDGLIWYPQSLSLPYATSKKKYPPFKVECFLDF